MTGKERVLTALRNQKPDRIPWVPFVGCHGGALIDVPADELLRSGELIAQGASAAIERYEPDGLPVTFDLQLEAEALGCGLNWSSDNPPAVVRHVLETASLTDLAVPAADAGRLGEVLSAARVLRERHPDIALYGLVTGPFTLALHLLGTEIFMKMYDAPETIDELMHFTTKVACAVSGYYVEAGCDVIAMVDPMTSQIGPDQFRQFVSTHAAACFERTRELGVPGSFFVCGHAEQNLQAMCETGCDSVSVDENIPLEYVRNICRPMGVSFGGNLQLTTVLLLGDSDDARRNAVACMEIGGEEGFILAPGCDLPYATPPENLAAVGEVVRDPYKREIAQALAAEQAPGDDLLDMQEYGQSDKVIVDIVTLDSEACAPCQYMVEAVRAIAPEFEGIVEWREHKIKYRESLVFMTSLLVRNVPTICIDGKIRFVSKIPPREELVRAIRERIYEKLRMKIRGRHGSILVLGDGGACCCRLAENARRAATELGADVDVRLVTDERAINSYGLAMQQTPAAVVAQHRVRATARVPEPAIIKEWIKDMLL